MSTAAPRNDSKSAKKRKAKAESAVAVNVPEPSPSTEQRNAFEGSGHPAGDGLDNNDSPPYIKELAKNIRNLNKKISATAKADSVVAENPGVSLDDLVASKKLNNDQKAQVERKPQLQSQVTQLEQQLHHYKTFAAEFETRNAREKEKLLADHETEIAQVRQDTLQEVEVAQNKKLEEGLLVISQFLHTAAAQRQSEDSDSDLVRAFEGALLNVYQGNDTAMTTFKRLIQGSEDIVVDNQGEPSGITFGQVKQAAMQNAAVPEIEDAAEELEAKDNGESNSEIEVQQASAPSDEIATDPTIAHATLTELEDAHSLTNGHETSTTAIPEQASITDDAANAVAQSNWDPESSMTGSAGDDFVVVPKDPAETDTGVAATPAAMHGTTSWAEEVAEERPAQETENDGFEQVRRDRGERGRGRGRSGGRGEHRGRGRGQRGEGHRGGRGEHRGEHRGRGGRGNERNGERRGGQATTNTV